MSQPSIRRLESAEVPAAFSLMKQLRPHLEISNYLQIYEAARAADRYDLYGYFEAGELLGLMGLRFLNDFVHGYHLYIDDLVVDEKRRSKGVGAALLQYAEALAAQNRCTGLRLCTGTENKEGIRFYERENWNLRAFVFKKKISASS